MLPTNIQICCRVCCLLWSRFLDLASVSPTQRQVKVKKKVEVSFHRIGLSDKYHFSVRTLRRHVACWKSLMTMGWKNQPVHFWWKNEWSRTCLLKVRGSDETHVTQIKELVKWGVVVPESVFNSDLCCDRHICQLKRADSISCRKLAN